MILLLYCQYIFRRETFFIQLSEIISLEVSGVIDDISAAWKPPLINIP